MNDPVGQTDYLRGGLTAVLRLGAGVAVVLIGIGTLAGLAGRDGAPTGNGFVGELSGGGAGSIVSLGLLVLVLTPVAALAAAVAGFVRQGERRYVVAAGVVLGLLVASLAAGLVIGFGGGG